MGLTLLRLLPLIPMVFSVAFCASAMDNAVQNSPQMPAHAMRPLVRFIGSDSLPTQPKTTIHTTVEKPTSHVQEPISQDRALDMIRAILAQHDLNAKTQQAEPSNPMSESTEPVPLQAGSFAFLANQPGDQQSILRSFAENYTAVAVPAAPAASGPAQKPVAVPEADFPCFGDGYCCCDGCPPGSCPSMFVSTDSGAILAEPLDDSAVNCPCAVPGEYCCCTGCPRGTCIAGSC
jgi:hypothetical protein